jgi:hypothetical protein
MSNNYSYCRPSYPYSYNNNQSNTNVNSINNTKFYETRFVICPFCGSQAHVKPTKTHRLMLRCDLCRALMFANAEVSQKYLLNLLEYRDDF